MNDDKQIYSIIDLDSYVNEMRKVAASSISENSSEDNLEEYITKEQVLQLVKTNCLGFDEESRPLLHEEANQKIFEEIAIWIHNVGLAKLAGKDLVECAWDNDFGEMVFWNKNS
jgi:hypothetical protein